MPGRQFAALTRAAVLLALAACAVSSPGAARPAANRQQPVAAPRWSRIELPAGVSAVTLASAGSRLLVGGRTQTNPPRPRMFLVASDGSRAEIALTAHSGYAAEAAWRSIVVTGTAITAVGGAPGGAHSITRWTAWSGTPTGVAELPQVFGTFGGVGAGDLIGAVVTTVGPAIVGSWESDASGLDATVWLPAGPKWVREPSTGTALASTADVLVSAQAATASGAAIVLAGSAVHLGAGGVRQQAAAWRSDRLNAGWRRVDLPDAGARSQVVTVACDGPGCLLTGYADGALAMWSLQGPSARRLAGVPAVAADVGVRIPAPLQVGDTIVQVVSRDSGVALLVRGSRRWALAGGPAGIALASAMVDGWLYVVIEQPDGTAGLWRCLVDDVIASAR